MINTVVLHIGLHKTGTTSFQTFIRDNEDLLHRNNLEPYRPLFRDNSRTANELGFAVLRPGVIDNLTPGLWNTDVRDADPRDWYVRIQRHLAASCSSSAHTTLLVSGEHLSFVRTPSEIQSLKALFPPTIKKFRVLLVLREKSSWLRSYRAEVAKWRHLVEGPIGSGRNEYAYLERNSWLTDFESLISVYEEGFGAVEVIPYTRNIIPALLSALHVPPPDNTDVFVNQTRNSLTDRLIRRFSAVLRSLGGIASGGEKSTDAAYGKSP